MLRLRRPTPAAVERFRKSQEASDFSYPEVGASQGEIPKGYAVDRYRVLLGKGERAFAAAKDALDRWEMFQLDWVTMFHAGPPRAGATVAVLIRLPGLYSLHAGRVVYTVEESRALTRHGFGYGTLRAHAEQGEERFLVEWDRSDDSVTYDVVSFSRARSVLARIAYSLTRSLQRRFVRDSTRAMLRAVDPRSSVD